MKKEEQNNQEEGTTMALIGVLCSVAMIGYALYVLIKF